MNQSIEKKRINHLEGIQSIDKLRKSLNYSAFNKSEYANSNIKELNLSNVNAMKNNIREASFDHSNRKKKQSKISHFNLPFIDNRYDQVSTSD